METTDKKPDKGGPNWPGITKWIVLGFILLIFLFLFRSQIAHLLDRTTSVTISEKGLELKTAETPLGTTTVSNAPGKLESNVATGIQGADYVNQEYRFRISWPVSGWTASETYGATLAQQMGFPPNTKVPLFIMRNEPVGNFTPNVNIVVEPVGSASISQYMQASVTNMQNMGWIILSSDMDEANNSGLIVLYNTMYESKVFQFMRIVVSGGNAFVVTASQLPPDDELSVALREELRSILNSFQMLV